MTKLNIQWYKLTVLCGLWLGLILVSCESNPLDIDVSHEKVSLKLDRMEQDVFSNNIPSTIERNKILLQKYGMLYEAFMVKMIGEGSPHDPEAAGYLKNFSEHPDMLEIYGHIEDKFSNFDAYHLQIEEGFKYYQHYFPDSALPRIITFYSNFNSNVFPYENNLAIGLDMYLGTDHEVVKSLPIQFFPQYLKEKMDDKYLVADAMKGWLMNRFAKEISDGDDFLSTIITLGKVMYLLDAMMPLEEDYIKFGCTQEQMEWCRFQEQNIWKSIIDEQVLYAKDKGVILQYVSDGPFTKGMPHESPSKVGVWLGWQIVRDYVEQNEIGVLELLKQTSPKVILKSYSQGDRD
jgi:hypothetical protein